MEQILWSNGHDLISDRITHARVTVRSLFPGRAF